MVVVVAANLLEARAAFTEAIVFASFGIVIAKEDLAASAFQVLPTEGATGLAMLILVGAALEAVGLGAISLLTQAPLISD